VRLGTEGAQALEMSIAGYQFPDAEDPRQRRSWHVVTGRATTGGESWEFGYPALTCDESPRLAAWLRAAADDIGHRRPVGDRRITFTEPNLAFEIVDPDRGEAQLRVELDLEFRPPSRRTDRRAGHPTVLLMSLSPTQLRAAAAAWDAETARFPAGPAPGS
jgi:hypothetical protein